MVVVQSGNGSQYFPQTLKVTKAIARRPAGTSAARRDETSERQGKTIIQDNGQEFAGHDVIAKD